MVADKKVMSLVLLWFAYKWNVIFYTLENWNATSKSANLLSHGAPYIHSDITSLLLLSTRQYIYKTLLTLISDIDTLQHKKVSRKIVFILCCTSYAQKVYRHTNSSIVYKQATVYIIRNTQNNINIQYSARLRHIRVYCNFTHKSIIDRSSYEFLCTSYAQKV